MDKTLRTDSHVQDLKNLIEEELERNKKLINQGYTKRDDQKDITERLNGKAEGLIWVLWKLKKLQDLRLRRG